MLRMLFVRITGAAAAWAGGGLVRYAVWSLEQYPIDARGEPRRGHG